MRAVPLRPPGLTSSESGNPLARTAAIFLTLGILVSYAISQRTHEIGIRMALGAQRRQILSLVGWQGLWLVTAGLAIGLSVAFAVGQLIRDFLVGIGPADAITYPLVSTLLATVAAAACLIPARQAVRIDPIVALRNE